MAALMTESMTDQCPSQSSGLRFPFELCGVALR